MFPKLFGARLANELLLTDKVLTAQEAVRSGFANGLVDTLDANSDWFDPSLIPIIPKLLGNDLRTMTNSM
jgi:enoyl-CoA hydratase/carnithine racemase